MNGDVPLRFALIDDCIVIINADGSIPVAPRVAAKLSGPLTNDLLHLLIRQANEKTDRCYRRFG